MAMSQLLDRFIAGAPTPLRLFFLGFVVAVLAKRSGRAASPD
jgi:hypothetical protein